MTQGTDFFWSWMANHYMSTIFQMNSYGKCKKIEAKVEHFFYENSINNEVWFSLKSKK